VTIQRRTLISPQDVIGLEYECNHCHARYSVPLGKCDRVTAICPNCNERWLKETQDTSSRLPDVAIIRGLVEFLHEVKTRQLGATIRLEIAGDIMPSASQTSTDRQ
jgi:hypothetical protein